MPTQKGKGEKEETVRPRRVTVRGRRGWFMPDPVEGEPVDRYMTATNGKLLHSDKFEEFYELYPKKVARGDARLAWNQVMRRGVDPDMLIAAVAISPCLMNVEKKYIPGPAPWLRQERWTDDPNAGKELKPWEYEGGPSDE